MAIAVRHEVGKYLPVSPLHNDELWLKPVDVEAPQGRGFVTPQDVKDLAPDVLRHRVLLTYEAEAEEVSADDVIVKVLARVPVP